MNKTILKNFAIDARNQLIEEIKNKAAMIGITEEGISSPLPASTSDLLLFDIQTVDPYILKGKEIRQYKRLVNELKQREENSDYDTAYETLIEEIAYTWFNRLIAIRFMEVNNYMPNRMRVLSSEIEGVNEPELVTNYLDSELDFTQEDIQQLAEWRLDGSARSMDQMFQFLFIKQANALNENLPGLFEKTDDYAELLLTISYNNPEGVLYKLVHEVPEEYFDVETEDSHGQVEIIGWLYEYYNNDIKEKIAKQNSSDKIQKENVPAATQHFTPDWIVKYMVENTLGRLWVEKLLAEGDRRSEKEIAESFNWKYYLLEAEQEPEVKENLIEIRADRRKLELEEICFMDPAMGSYHIGVYAFEVFMQLYKSLGYSPRDAAELIIAKNLFGLDIDKRAYQLSYFAILMKGRQYNRRILSKGLKPNLYSIVESNSIDRNHLNYLGTNVEDIEGWENTKEDIIEILDLFIDSKEYGSILKIDDNYNFGQMKKFTSNIEENIQMSFETIGIEETQKKILNILSIAEILSTEYDVLVTNPPYLGNPSQKMTEYIIKNYPEERYDLYSVFIKKGINLLKENGYQSMVTGDSWMFIKSFEKFRKKIINRYGIKNLIHLGPGAFDVGFSTVAFVVHKSKISINSSCIDLRNETINKNNILIQKIKNNDVLQVQYKKMSFIPGSPMAYWVPEKIIDTFKYEPLSKKMITKAGIVTGNNQLFMKTWFEVNYLNIKFNSLEFKDVTETKWVPTNKGGSYRKWFGNLENIVNIKDIWDDSKITKSVRRGDKNYYFKKGITWSTLSNRLGARKSDSGFVWDTKGSMAFPLIDNNLYTILGLMNSSFASEIMNILSPTLDFNKGYIEQIPTKEISTPVINRINRLVKENIDLSRKDWNNFEITWNFKKHPLLNENIKSSLNELKKSYKNLEKHTNFNFEQLKENEEKLNEIFIDIYDLEEELTPEVSDKDITITKIFDDKKNIYEDIKGNQYIQTKEDIIKSFISYAVGCMFGRYSLDEEGLIYAGGEWDESKYETFKPVEDNVLLITDEDYFEDDITHRFVEFVKVVYGEETLEENLDFIADSLNGRGSSREKIRNYFMNNFYKDHCQQYSVRGSGKLPIYWMYDSSAGKTRRNSADGFKALVYMHRYDEDTTGKVRMDYLHKVQRAYEQKIDNLEYRMELTDSAREIADAEKEIEKLTKQLKELQDYDERIGHLALSRIPIDLDDGVRVNYDKVQTDENGKKLKILAKR